MLVDRYGGRQSTKTSGGHFVMKAVTLAHEIKYICMNTSPIVNRDSNFFLNQIVL